MGNEQIKQTLIREASNRITPLSRVIEIRGELTLLRRNKADNKRLNNIYSKTSNKMCLLEIFDFTGEDTYCLEHYNQ